MMAGDSTKEANGVMVKVPGNFPGALHTHASGDMGVVVAGSVTHRQDGQAKAEKLVSGDFWHQPAGTAHITSCVGKDACIGFVHFDGKFDFAPAEPKKGAKPDAGYVEKRAKDLKWEPVNPTMGDKGPMVAILWGDPKAGAHGMVVKMPDGMKSPLHTHSADYHAVVLKGTVMNHGKGDAAPKEMPVGSYWFQPGSGAHVTACKAGSACAVYAYMMGKHDFAPAE